MNELLEKEQIIRIVPQNFKNSNKGKVIDIQDRKFLVEVLHKPEGILPNKIMEFYSQTKNGMLYFTSSAAEIDGNILTIPLPRKHRFLQRRAFTRVKFIRDIPCSAEGKEYTAVAMDISAGGMKLKTKQSLNIDAEYDLSIPMLKDQKINCKYSPIRIEKSDDESYTLSGRFKNISNADKMILTQFCMRKNIENANK